MDATRLINFFKEGKTTRLLFYPHLTKLLTRDNISEVMIQLNDEVGQYKEWIKERKIPSVNELDASGKEFSREYVEGLIVAKEYFL